MTRVSWLSSSALEEQSQALHSPERAKRPHGVTGKRLRPSWPAHFLNAEGTLKSQDQRNKAELGEFYPDVEAYQGSGSSCRGSPALVSALAKPNPCKSPKPPNTGCHRRGYQNHMSDLWMPSYWPTGASRSNWTGSSDVTTTSTASAVLADGNDRKETNDDGGESARVMGHRIPDLKSVQFTD